MPAQITVSNLSWSTPDGQSLFSDLNLSFPLARAGLVGRNGVGKSTLLSIISGGRSAHSGTVTVQGSVGTLRQTLQPEPGETIASLFGITEALALLARAEAGIADAEDLANADWTLEARLAAALAQFGIDTPPQTPLETLSGGQRTRVMLAALVFAEPDFILLDEPTNNLDRDGRRAIIDMLAAWRGGAVVVSHDRELLETMDEIVELTALGATTYGGNWSHYRERKALELAAAHHDLETARQSLAQIDRKTQTVKERKARKDATGKRNKTKGGAPRILLNAMQGRAEKTSGENARIASRQREQAMSDVQSAQEKLERLEPLSVTLPSCNLPATRRVASIENLTGGHNPDNPAIRDFALEIIGPERIALSGPNGSGKTTLLKLLTGHLPALHGKVEILVPYALLDQQVSLLDPAQTIRDNFLRLNPGATENMCRAALARFKFRADAALRNVNSLSGGQILRAGLACVLSGNEPPQLLILDEPTNHLDIEAIEAVEAGLRAYDGALLVVSHDQPFLEATGIIRKISLG